MSVQSDASATVTNFPEKAKEVPFSGRFLDKDNEQARRTYLRSLLSGCLAVIIALFSILSIFWGSAWKVPAGRLEGWVIDFDGGVVGQTVVHALTSTPSTVIAWTTVSASEFPGGLSQLSEALIHQKTWVAIAINEGATARLHSSYLTPNAAYNGSNAMTVFADEGRSETAYRNFLRPTFETSLAAISQSFAVQSANALVSSESTNYTSLLLTSPQTIAVPIWFTINNVAPFDIPVASAVTLIGLIYQLILTFFTVSIAYSAREASGLNRRLTYRSLVLTRFVSSFGVYFIVSLCFSLLSLAFQVNFTRHYGKSGFVIFWMVNWFEMSATGLALESLITLLTPRFISFFMLLLVIVNLSVCSNPIEILPSIYRYGYAAPFYNVSHAARSILFGTKNTLGLNFGVLTAWIAISCVTLPLIQWYVRRKEVIAAMSTDEKPRQEVSV